MKQGSTVGVVALALLVALSSVNVFGADSASSLSQPIVDITYVFKVLGALLLVFGVFFALIYLLNKTRVISSKENALKVISTIRVGSREKILLLDVEGSHVLVGVTPQRISTLFQQGGAAGCGAEKAGNAFSELLGQARDENSGA